MTAAEGDLNGDGSWVVAFVVKEAWATFVKVLESEVSDSGEAVGEVNSPKSMEALALSVALSVAVAVVVALAVALAGKLSELGRVSVAYVESDAVIRKSVVVD
jgi:hypothetical protein